jgi:MFS family permease
VGPAAGGYVASHFGIRYAFFVTAAMCALALVGLIVLFSEVEPAARGARRPPPPRLPLRQVLAYPQFPVILAMLVAAQFLDRALALLIPLHVASLSGVSAVAATSGAIISVAAVTATVSANVVARLSRDIAPARLLTVALLAGGPLCAGMALANGWPALLVLRALVGLALGGAITLAYTLGAAVVPGEQRGVGWLALGVQFGTAASPLVTGALAAVSLPGAFLACGALALAAAALLTLGTRGAR